MGPASYQLLYPAKSVFVRGTLDELRSGGPADNSVFGCNPGGEGGIRTREALSYLLLSRQVP